MTENDRTDDGADRTDGEHPIEDVPAAIHRQLSDAGIRINEGQTHLSAVRTQAARGDPTNEIAHAEAEALVHALEASREHIDEALAMANRLTATDTGDGDEAVGETVDDEAVGDETDDRAADDETDDDQTASEDDSETAAERSDDDPDDGSRMLWNTAHVVAPNHPR